MAVNYAPCGHCRQFMQEYRGAKDLTIDILSLNVCKALPELLPHAFTPRDLGVDDCLFESRRRQSLGFALETKDETALKALAGLNTLSHSPYSNSHSAVALRMRDGAIFTGAYIESCAYNPSLPPAQSAVVQLVASHYQYSDIKEVRCLCGCASSGPQLVVRRPCWWSGATRPRHKSSTRARYCSQSARRPWCRYTG